MILNNKVYDVCKFIVQILLPALGSLYFAFAEIYGANVFPYGEEVVGSIMAIDAFLGAILGISSIQYNKKIGGAE